ncbi:Smr/MutS family protein [Sphingorhabdus sp.]|uniref:Smr/MutS family protein n=1 Tax=Sphingorhabdus sp. TaxID=1902408 RepID=UPI00391B1236
MARHLDSTERSLWGKVIATVKPMHGGKAKPVPVATPTADRAALTEFLNTKPKPVPNNANPKHATIQSKFTPVPHNLDGHWDKRIRRGSIVPDVSIDLHDASLSLAYNRLDGALEQAITQRMKVILLVTGKSRTHDRASGEGRGAIAAVVRDWLAASRHARHISAVRNAHPRHGGAGALYIILKT